MTKPPFLTLDAYLRGQGTPLQRKRAADQLSASMAEALPAALEYTQALSDLQLLLRPDEKLLTIDRARIESDPKTARIVALLDKLRGRLEAVHKVFTESGHRGGVATAQGNKKPGGLTHVQTRRVARYRDLLAKGHPKPIDAMAGEEDCTPQAIRDSLKAAGIEIAAVKRGRKSQR